MIKANKYSGQLSFKKALKVGFFLLSLTTVTTLYSASASADANWELNQNPAQCEYEIGQLNFPNLVNAPTAEIGDALSPPVTTVVTYLCKRDVYVAAGSSYSSTGYFFSDGTYIYAQNDGKAKAAVGLKVFLNGEDISRGIDAVVTNILVPANVKTTITMTGQLFKRASSSNPNWRGATNSLLIGYALGQGKNTAYHGYLSAGNPSQSIVPTCSVSPDSVNKTVNMNEVKPSDFGAVGSTANINNFYINVTGCTNGENMYMSLTDSTNPSNRTNILTPSAGTTAKGVGYQVSVNGQPISFGPDNSTIGAENQILAGTAVGSNFQIPMSVQYIRTGDVKGGALNGLATFTMVFN